MDRPASESRMETGLIVTRQVAATNKLKLKRWGGSLQASMDMAGQASSDSAWQCGTGNLPPMAQKAAAHHSCVCRQVSQLHAL